ncbi:hypothetical protein [Brevibacillus brevis]|uniref:hypothetical protein n=1 Tax=Brevibacillus brevis TaxID=1393 RepID=UPI000D10B2C2|nr:hypothetical protein [Brevibacillus brevis]PSJ67466.1 hypothetical protein C7J99_20965 [Brevibacillus brevis]RED28455.1 hypothetical protein DES34_108322 [Brevibacillus brevis]GEC90709.1 hypothetical protein BBR01nite_30400 [Brevibacillus brevis]VEF91150.1 Uncharacterised protein [Brevibacillus brevis]
MSILKNKRKEDVAFEQQIKFSLNQISKVKISIHFNEEMSKLDNISFVQQHLNLSESEAISYLQENFQKDFLLGMMNGRNYEPIPLKDLQWISWELDCNLRVKENIVQTFDNGRWINHSIEKEAWALPKELLYQHIKELLSPPLMPIIKQKEVAKPSFQWLFREPAPPKQTKQEPPKPSIEFKPTKQIDTKKMFAALDEAFAKHSAEMKAEQQAEKKKEASTAWLGNLEMTEEEYDNLPF